MDSNFHDITIKQLSLFYHFPLNVSFKFKKSVLTFAKIVKIIQNQWQLQQLTVSEGWPYMLSAFTTLRYNENQLAKC